MLDEKKDVQTTEYNHSISKKIKEFDEKITKVDKTVDELFELTQKMLLDIGEIK